MHQHNHIECVEKALHIAHEKAEKVQKRLTDNRLKVFKILLQSHRAIGAYEILNALNANDKQQKKVQPPTVYRALDFLLELELIHKLESQNQFFACLMDDVDHANHLIAAFICDGCGEVSERAAEKNIAYLHEAGDEIGFKLDKVIMECHGTCKACANIAN